jgi:hypothetical protein
MERTKNTDEKSSIKGKKEEIVREKQKQVEISPLPMGLSYLGIVSSAEEKAIVLKSFLNRSRRKKRCKPVSLSQLRGKGERRISCDYASLHLSSTI